MEVWREPALGNLGPEALSDLGNPDDWQDTKAFARGFRLSLSRPPGVLGRGRRWSSRTREDVSAGGGETGAKNERDCVLMDWGALCGGEGACLARSVDLPPCT